MIPARKVIAKVSWEEVLEKFVSPPDSAAVVALVKAGRLSETEAALAFRIPAADDITVEADSGGHTDGRPLVPMLPALIALANLVNLTFVSGKEKHKTQLTVFGAILPCKFYCKNIDIKQVFPRSVMI